MSKVLMTLMLSVVILPSCTKRGQGTVIEKKKGGAGKSDDAGGGAAPGDKTGTPPDDASSSQPPADSGTTPTPPADSGTTPTPPADDSPTTPTPPAGTGTTPPSDTPGGVKEDEKINAGGGSTPPGGGSIPEEEKINAGGASASGSGSTPPSGGTTTTGTKFKKPPTGYNESMISNWASKAGCTGTVKCVHVPPQALANDDLLNLVRVGIFKAINHLCFGPKELVFGDDVSEGYGLVFKVDMARCWGANAEANWAKAIQAQRKGVGVSPAASPLIPITNVGNSTPGHHLAYNLLHGEVYNNILAYPGQEFTFNQVFQANPKIIFTSAVKDAIVCGPRLITGHKYTLNGAQYWYVKSHDEFDGRAGGDISDQYKAQAPTERDYRDGSGSTSMTLASKLPGQESVASEWWLEMPNGFLAFGIHGEGSQERTRAELPFAVDPYTPSGCLETGRCINCHSAGVRGVRSTPESTSGAGWTRQEDLDRYYGEVRKKYADAQAQLIDRMSDASESLKNDIINGVKEPALFAERLYEDQANLLSGAGPCGSCESFCSGQFAKNGLCTVGRQAGRIGAGAAAGAASGGVLGGFLGGR